MAENERKTKILELVSNIAADVCAVDLSLIQSGTTLLSLGIDSMKGMAFINSVYDHISCKIPVLAVLEEDSTIQSISDLIFL